MSVSETGVEKTEASLANPCIRLAECLPLQLCIEQLRLEDLKKQWRQQRCIRLSPFDLTELRGLRDELVADLRGLQPIETSHTQALVLPLEDGRSEGASAVDRLEVTFRAEQFKSLVQKITGCKPLTRQRCALVAVPPGGHVLPQCFAGEHDCGEVAFALFLTEDWWSEKDGGQFEVYPEEGKPGKVYCPEPGLLLYAAGAGAGITRVLTEDAPQLAVHGIFGSKERQEEAEIVKAQEAPFRICSAEARGKGHRALDNWVSEKFLGADAEGDLRAQFEEASHMKLQGFLNQPFAQRIAAAIDTASAAATLKGWQESGPIQVQRFLAWNQQHDDGAQTCPVGKALEDVANCMASSGFLRYLEAITGVTQASAATLRVRRFRPGLDFQRPANSAQCQLDVILCFEAATPSLRRPKRRFRAQLQALGGADGYVEGTEAYKRTAEAAGILAGPAGIPAPLPALLRLPLRNNVLRLVLRDPRTSHYVEPLQFAAPTSRWDICLTLPVEELPDSGEEEEEANGSKLGGPPKRISIIPWDCF